MLNETIGFISENPVRVISIAGVQQHSGIPIYRYVPVGLFDLAFFQFARQRSAVHAQAACRFGDIEA